MARKLVNADKLLPVFQIMDRLGLKGGYLGLLIPYIAFGIPMSVMILVGFYKGIPKEMEEAAYIDGCGKGVKNIVRYCHLLNKFVSINQVSLQ